MVLPTSAEHYGAALNADFDFRKYLQTMYDEGMNYTRIFMMLCGKGTRLMQSIM